MVSKRRLTESLRSELTAVSKDIYENLSQPSPPTFFCPRTVRKNGDFAENFYPLTSQANNKMPN